MSQLDQREAFAYSSILSQPNQQYSRHFLFFCFYFFSSVSSNQSSWPKKMGIKNNNDPFNSTPLFLSTCMCLLVQYRYLEIIFINNWKISVQEEVKINDPYHGTLNFDKYNTKSFTQIQQLKNAAQSVGEKHYLYTKSQLGNFN